MKIKSYSLKYLFDEDLTKKIMVLSFLISICAFYLYKINYKVNINIIDGVVSVMTNNLVCIILYFVILLFSSITVYKKIGKNSIHLLRFKTKREYLIVLIKSIIKSNTFTFILVFIMNLLIFSFFSGFNFGFRYVEFYKTFNLIYLIFMAIKIYILSNLLSLISILLFEIINEKIVYLLNLIIYSTTFLTYYESTSIDSLLEIKLLLGNYLMILNYSSFIFEILLFIIYSLLIVMGSSLLFEYVSKKEVDVS